MNLIDDSLCAQTVTLYRKTSQGIRRQVVENAYLSRKDSWERTAQGGVRGRTFTLILPGDSDLACGDRVWEGIGPDVRDWNAFVPSCHDQLVEVGYVKKYRWDGRVCHVQAGSR